MFGLDENLQMMEEGRKKLFTQLLKIRREYTEIYLLGIPSLFFGQRFPHCYTNLDAVANHYFRIFVAAPAYSLAWSVQANLSPGGSDRIEVKREIQRERESGPK